MGNARKITRLEDWPTRLALFLKERADMPFRWGHNDCLLLSASAVEAITGVDYASYWRGKYNDKRGAVKILENYGGLRDAVSQKLNVEYETNVLLAGRGDVVCIVDDNGHEAIGVVDASGKRVTAFLDEKLAQLPLTRATCVWRY